MGGDLSPGSPQRSGRLLGLMQGSEAACFLMPSCVLFQDEKAQARTGLAPKARDPHGEKLEPMDVMSK